jgi:hypothetical protein
MTLRRLRELIGPIPSPRQAAFYTTFGFFCDLASTGFTRSVASNHPWLAIGCNLVLMLITWKVFLKIEGWLLFAAWIIGQSAGIRLALML